MKEHEKDNLADALARMSAGEAADEPTVSEPEGDAADQHQPAQTPPPPSAALFRPPTEKDKPASAGKPPQEKVVKPPAARVRPSGPPTRPASPNLTPPAPAAASSAAAAPSKPRRAGTATTPIYRKLEFRRTIIPILLTLGVMLPLLGALPLLVSADSPLAAVQSSVALTFIGVGLVLLLLAVVNMIQVRHELAQKASGPAR